MKVNFGVNVFSLNFFKYIFIISFSSMIPQTLFLYIALKKVVFPWSICDFCFCFFNCMFRKESNVLVDPPTTLAPSLLGAAGWGVSCWSPWQPAACRLRASGPPVQSRLLLAVTHVRTSMLAVMTRDRRSAAAGATPLLLLAATLCLLAAGTPSTSAGKFSPVFTLIKYIFINYLTESSIKRSIKSFLHAFVMFFYLLQAICIVW